MRKFTGIERRRYPRIYKTFIISYRLLQGGEVKTSVTRLKNISEGGLAFKAEEGFKEDDILLLNIRLPLAKEAVAVKGKVLESKKVLHDVFYEIRVCFTDINDAVKKHISELARMNPKGM